MCCTGAFLEPPCWGACRVLHTNFFCLMTRGFRAKRASCCTYSFGLIAAPASRPIHRLLYSQQQYSRFRSIATHALPYCAISHRTFWQKKASFTTFPIAHDSLTSISPVTLVRTTSTTTHKTHPTTPPSAISSPLSPPQPLTTPSPPNTTPRPCGCLPLPPTSSRSRLGRQPHCQPTQPT